MAAQVPRKDGSVETVKAPGSLTISTYVTCPDITKVVTPDLKYPGKSQLFFIDLGGSKNRLGGSALAQVFGQVGDSSPDMDDAHLFKQTFNTIQELVRRGMIAAGHDRSDGGLITTLLEMALAGNCGVEVDLPGGGDPIALLFSEELGLLIEPVPGREREVADRLSMSGIPFSVIGRTLTERSVHIKVSGRTVLSEELGELRLLWEETSYRLDLLQANPSCVEEERRVIAEGRGLNFDLTFSPEPTDQALLERSDKPRVAIIREEGSNGDREMASAFYAAGFEPWDVTMSDLLEGRASLDDFKGVAFVGGFSFADVLDSAKGWAGLIRFNRELSSMFDRFYRRSDTFSLGVCNGCQLMALLGWVPWRGIEDKHQPRFIRNESGRFESRFISVKILPSPSIMLRGMEGSILGVWVAHGEGRAYFPRNSILEEVERRSLAPVRFVDDLGQVTERYPFNPNGSPHGITGLCSPDGRHLALMPHPERTFLKWQWAWMPQEMKRSIRASPWLRMFQNAREWVESRD